MIYEYFEGSILTDLMEEFYTLPLTTIKTMIRGHLQSHPSIFSSELILGSSKNSKGEEQVSVKYLAFDEDEEISGGSATKRLQEHMEEKQG